MLIRRLLLLCALGALLAGPATADTTISNSTTTPQKTSTGGNITINSSGSVTIETAGAAVTIDSNNTVTNNGGISNKSATGAIGVLLEGGGADAAFVGSGRINLQGKDATGGIGIEVGPVGFTGDITMNAGSTMNVTGDNSTGLAIFGPLVGNVTLAGTVVVIGTDATGLLSTAPITGSIMNSGSISARGTATLSTTEINPESGSALAIGASVSAGIYNAGPADSTDTTLTAVISSQGSAPTVHISPSLAGSAAANLVIGPVDDPKNLAEGFSLLNRGTISSNGTDPGVNSTAILIAGDSSGHTATLTEGIFNRGTINASANSGTGTASAAAADATAIEIGDGGIVSEIENTGKINAITNGLAGGAATALLIDADGSLALLKNSGTITATATVPSSGTPAELVACAICDFSGTLTTLINNGTIQAVATELDDDSQVTIAADLSHAASGTNLTFTNAGIVSGDVLFGASSDTLNVEGAGQLVGDVLFGSGANRLNISGTATTAAFVNGVISYDPTGGGTLLVAVGSGGTLRTNSADATTFNVAPGGTVTFVLGATGPAPGSNEGIITTTAGTSFAASSRVGFGFDSSLPDSGTYALIYAGGGLTFPVGNANAADNVTILGAPFIYDIDLTLPNANELVIEFTRKTAAQLGFKGNIAAIYDPAVEAARGDPLFGAALMSLFTEEAVESALTSLMPDVSGDTRAVAIALTDQSTGPIGARQRTLLQYVNNSAGLNLWGQEYVHVLSDNGGSGFAGYDGRGFGFSLGADGGTPGSGRYGGGFTFFAGNVQENDPRDSKTEINWYMLSLYSAWRGHVLFFNTQANAAYGTFSGERVIRVDGLRRRATGEWSDYLASGGFSTGLILKGGPFVFMPQWNVDALYVRASAYSESGAFGQDLEIDARSEKSLRSFFGLVIRDNIDLGNGYLEPEIRGGWSYDFLNDPDGVTAAFADVSNPGLKFTLTPALPSASRIIGGASLSWAYQSWSLGFNYDIAASSGALAHSGTVTLTGRI